MELKKRKYVDAYNTFVIYKDGCLYVYIYKLIYTYIRIYVCVYIHVNLSMWNI